MKCTGTQATLSPKGERDEFLVRGGSSLTPDT